MKLRPNDLQLRASEWEALEDAYGPDTEYWETDVVSSAGGPVYAVFTFTADSAEPFEVHALYINLATGRPVVDDADAWFSVAEVIQARAEAAEVLS